MLYVSVVWLLATAVVFVGFLIVQGNSKIYIPNLIANFYIFGKLREHKKYNLHLHNTFLHFPKSWFYHFYLTGIICNSAVLYSAVSTFCWTGKWPEMIAKLLRYMQIPSLENIDPVSPVPVLLALVMEEIQVIRRFLECVLLNSYSNSKMSVLIYLVGVLFYACFGISLLTLSQEGKLTSRGSFISEITWYQVLCILLFIWASWKQYRVNRILVKLRQNKQGQVTNSQHHIPHGDLFEYSSCPHYFLEILIYTAICGVFAWRHEVCVCIWTFVFINQLIAGHLTHKWYKDWFPKYPSKRAAVIPFVF